MRANVERSAGGSGRHLRPPSRRRLAAGGAAPRTRAERGRGRPRHAATPIASASRRASGPQQPGRARGYRSAGCRRRSGPGHPGRRGPRPAGGERRRIATGGEALLLDESYNANPASMRAALAVLGRSPGRRIAVLGDMLELGAERRRPPCRSVRHRGGGGSSSSSPAAHRWRGCTTHCRRHGAVSMPATPPPWRRPSSRRCGPGDVVLVKGSLGSRMARVVAALTGSGAPFWRARRHEERL